MSMIRSAELQRDAGVRGLSKTCFGSNLVTRRRNRRQHRRAVRMVPPAKRIRYSCVGCLTVALLANDAVSALYLASSAHPSAEHPFLQ